jgi:hypothetical protein
MAGLFGSRVIGMNLDRERLRGEEIFDQQLRDRSVRMLEPDFADRLVGFPDRTKGGRQITPAPWLFDPAGKKASCGHAAIFRIRLNKAKL